jgi:hypothetical protein
MKRKPKTLNGMTNQRAFGTSAMRSPSDRIISTARTSATPRAVLMMFFLTTAA